ncbi:Por secretion system C-terminal sorting domain-containing protein [Aquimarina amphilecti]|uniref:Por secretion system C-terminal sorting domain-containing protein n=1 Tax=Aquimarina amphilecti TaxID=1038014 RepID=A0A1H7FSU6_AQUAM|nr:beta-1,3-glucanase family protein [Aquimarina amphilecti]SEK26425.1 Por secretion system C-terminal sorting domain-containing protein [Aquimarina amphilecti]
MKTNLFLKTEPKIKNFPKLLGLLLFFSVVVKGQTLPYEIVNTSEYPDNEVFVAIVGITDGHVWVDPVNGQVHNMDPSINTVQGPVIDGNQGPGLDGKYADCFRKLSDIPNKTIQIPKIGGCRIMISFKSQLYLYFFGHSGSPSGYAAPNLANHTDPNQGIKFELIELTFNDFGLWCNTSRVDAYQYPMGLEVWGDNFYKKVGELKEHAEILDQWKSTAPSEFQSLLKESDGSIHFPTKVETFPDNFMDGYINDIWSKYSNQELAFTSDAGIWRGSVQGTNFVFRRDSDGQIGTIFGKPTTIEAMEGSGVMALGDRWDLVVQSQMVAAITRHAVDLNISSGVLQDFGDTSKYYQTWPYNWYSKFFHQTDISFESQTYTFAYDDVYNQSATIHTPNPRNIKITLGGIDGNSTPNDPPVTLYLDCSYSGIEAGLSEGSYTLSQLTSLGIPNDKVSSLRVRSGYKATLYWDDNFTGASLVKTTDDSCLTNDDNWNDKMTSIIISKTTDNEVSQLIEAENFSSMNGVQIEPCIEGGENVGYIDNGDWMVYNNINFPTSGNYLIEYRVAGLGSNARLSSDLNAGAIILGEVDIPNTGGWQNWTTVSHLVTVSAGTYPFGIYAISGGWNINWIKITNQDSQRLNEIDDVKTDSFEIITFPNPAIDQLNIYGVTSKLSLFIVDVSGKVIQKIQVPAGNEVLKVDISSLQTGTYFIKTYQNNTWNVSRFIKK